MKRNKKLFAALCAFFAASAAGAACLRYFALTAGFSDFVVQMRLSRGVDGYVAAALFLALGGCFLALCLALTKETVPSPAPMRAFFRRSGAVYFALAVALSAALNWVKHPPDIPDLLLYLLSLLFAGALFSAAGPRPGPAARAACYLSAILLVLVYCNALANVYFDFLSYAISVDHALELIKLITAILFVVGATRCALSDDIALGERTMTVFGLLGGVMLFSEIAVPAVVSAQGMIAVKSPVVTTDVIYSAGLALLMITWALAAMYYRERPIPGIVDPEAQL